ncbi:MAG: hypothetical protein NC102_03495 [Clostridium sp.]|nr:hypothetical protein [Clostridium sp.]
MNQEFNPARYGLTLQSLICDIFKIKVNDKASAQFNANYDESSVDELLPIIHNVVKSVGAKPIKLLTYTLDLTNGKHTTSPHNFLLSNGKTLSLRTTSSTGMVAPRTVGQAGFDVLNKYFYDIFGEEVCDQAQIRKKMYYHIHEALPIFIECFFPSDYNIIIERMKDAKEPPRLSLYKLSDIANYSFERNEFTFTRDLDTWVESTTLKYHGVSIAELQTHRNRTFKFRFNIKAIPKWFRILKNTTETFGITAEATICDVFGLEKPNSFATRTSNSIYSHLLPIVKEAFKTMPKPIRHTGSEAGERGKSSKCSYDFILEGGKQLSLKTNTGNRICPPEVGQPGPDTCLLYFKDYLPQGVTMMTNDLFKQMVFDKIECLIPIYLSHLFDSDWLLWIYKSGDIYKFEAIQKSEINYNFPWVHEKFTFTKDSIEDWKESNTVKYDGKTIGEFQVHNHRACFKFRFHMPTILKLLRINKN